MGQERNPRVIVIEIKDEIDPRVSHYVELAIEEAKNIEADYMILEMDTYGGTLNDAKDIVEMILDYDKPVWVFINKDAASAGALISIACDSIYMAAGASIGAATVVTADGAAAPDKYQSYMRATMRATAEENGRDPRIAEAMVDQTIEIDSISPAGQVITFSTTEALKHGFCDAKVASITEILERNQVKNYETTTFHLSSTDTIISFFLNPFISGILMLIIIGGIYFELQSPGVGFPILAALVAAVLYFVPYYLNGLAENWEILMFFAGIALIAAEIFVIPGFGVAGVTGVIFTFGGLILVMLNNDNLDFSFVSTDKILISVITAVSALLGAGLLLFMAGGKIINSRAFSKIALSDTLDSSEGFTSNFNEEGLIGKEGVAQTILRPSGKILLNENIYDAYTRGNYIDKGEKIIVISDEGTSLKVKKA